MVFAGVFLVVRRESFHGIDGFRGIHQLDSILCFPSDLAALFRGLWLRTRRDLLRLLDIGDR